MEESIPKDVIEVLEKCFSDNIDNFEVIVHSGNKKGEGFLSDLLFLSLKNRLTNKNHDVIIKQALPNDTGTNVEFLSVPFVTEIHFYTKILPALQKFQESFPEAKHFDNLPICYGVESLEGKEKILLQNLKPEGYSVHPKTVPLTNNMYQEIFKLYGKYHALSFAFKELHEEKFSELLSPLNNNWLKFIETPLFERGVKESALRVKSVLEHRNEEKMTKKIQKYVDDANVMFKKVIQDKSPYGVILHGDAWSNNMMFKYDDSGELKDIKLLDFQMVYIGSPTLDLSYSFYSGAGKESLNNLDDLLKLYHASLEENLKQYGLNAENIYPFDALKEEWKKYCQFGFIMGYLVWGMKNIDENDVPDLNQVYDETKDYFSKVKPNAESYSNAVYNLMEHVCEKDFI